MGEDEGWGSLAPTLSRDDCDDGFRAPTLVDVSEGTGRYAEGHLIGKGGMGEVWACVDRRIGREVAVKVVRAGGRAEAGRLRFLQEARVQARLEHPAIVPVYDLGLGPDGGAFFTMKRVRGSTLQEVLSALADHDVRAAESFGRRRLLNAFGQVCLAVDFAHARGFVHRDIKPGNVMLGDFGEVHLLDWGLAKEREPDETGMRKKTRAGQILGTPGYMAPEQTAGGPVDARTDVYSLGAVLYEILTLAKRAEVPTRSATIHAIAATASSGVSSIDPPPPELMEVCDRAMAHDPDGRYPSARALWAEVERYLDGDRDLELRRTRAEQHARAAEQALQQAVGGPSATVAHEARRRALRELGQALALDPGHRGARRALVDLLVQPPAELPAEVEQELAQSQQRTGRVAGLFGSLGFLYCLLVCPLGWWMGVRDPWFAGLWIFAMTASALLRFTTVVRPRWSFRGTVLVLSTAAFAMLARLFGPFLFLPGVLAAATVSYSMLPSRRLRWASVLVGTSAVIIPWLLERAGVLSPSYTFDNGTLVVHSALTSMPAGPTTALLLVTSLGVILIPMLFIGRTGRAHAEAERRIALHAWHLRQLVPGDREEGR